MATQASSSRSPRKRGGHRGQTKASSIDIEDIDIGKTYESARDKINEVGRRVRGAFSSDFIIPITVGSFTVGVAAGVLGAVYWPKIMDSELMRDIEGRLGEAKTNLGERLSAAKNTMSRVTKDMTEPGKTPLKTSRPKTIRPD